MKKLFAILGIIAILTMSAVPAFAGLVSIPPGGEPITLEPGYNYYVQFDVGVAWVSKNPIFINHDIGRGYIVRLDTDSRRYQWTGTNWIFTNTISYLEEVPVDNAPFDEYHITTLLFVRANHDIKILMENDVRINPVPTNPVVFFSPPQPPPPAFLPATSALPLPHQITPTLTVLLGVGILVLGLAVLVPRLVIWVIHSFRR